MPPREVNLNIRVWVSTICWRISGEFKEYPRSQLDREMDARVCSRIAVDATEQPLSLGRGPLDQRDDRATKVLGQRGRVQRQGESPQPVTQAGRMPLSSGQAIRVLVPACIVAASATDGKGSVQRRGSGLRPRLNNDRGEKISWQPGPLESFTGAWLVAGPNDIPATSLVELAIDWEQIGADCVLIVM